MTGSDRGYAVSVMSLMRLSLGVHWLRYLQVSWELAGLQRDAVLRTVEMG